MTQKVIRSSLHKAYDQQYDTGQAAWRTLSAKLKADNIEYVCENWRFNKVLEVGCGDGAIMEALDRRGFAPHMEAVEISSSAIREMKLRKISSLKRVKRYNGGKLPYKTKSFDLAILSHVLEHVEDPRFVLRELKRVSRFQVIEILLLVIPLV